MHPDFGLPGQRDYVHSYQLPDNYRGMVLRGANIVTARNTSGLMILQDL